MRVIVMPKFRSKFEATFARQLKDASIKYDYEPEKILYSIVHNYTPDFKLAENVFIETKGLWTGNDRNKHKHVRDQNPDIKILLVFQDPFRSLSKKSKTTYVSYCDKLGWAWSSSNMADVKAALDKLLNT